MEPEAIPEHRPNIVDAVKRLQKVGQAAQFAVGAVLIPAHDRDAVAEVIPKGLDRVVHDERPRQIATEHAEVLQIGPVDHGTRVAEQPMPNAQGQKAQM